jgi:hypothetical protein
MTDELDFGEPDRDYGIGIDPGWRNLGLAIVQRFHGEENIELVHSCTLDPAALGGIIGTMQEITRICVGNIDWGMADVISSRMERYVPYNGVFSTEAENITMLIGGLYHGLDSENLGEPGLVRAIDWKTNLVKALFKWKKFQNPSDKLDKKFSVAAAKACISNDKGFNTDHEADAICIASLGFIPNL